MENLTIRKANNSDIDKIWELIQQGILKRKIEGSDQWQDGYPNRDVIVNDVANDYGIVVLNAKNIIIGYIAMINEVEAVYEEITGNWLSPFNEKYMVLHRLVVEQDNPLKGLATWLMKEIEQLVLVSGITSIKVDTNFDNPAMLRVFNKLDYQYCGKVYIRGKERLAFEKLLR